MAREIETATLKSWMDEGRRLVLLDVLPRDAFDELRLPGARNACVYEVTFLEQVGKAGVPKDAPVVVYCSGPESRASADACERLEAAGFADVRRYAGGRAAWLDAGHPTEGTRAGGPWVPDPSPALPDGEHALDTEKSVLLWVGRNAGGRHDGTLRFRSGVVKVEDGHVAGGSFAIDMDTIEVGDLAGDLARTLVQHLRSADFFAVEEHPTATLELLHVAPLHGVAPGQPNLSVEAQLTMRGQTQRLTFHATAAAHREGGLAVEAHFDLDRTRWGVAYGSGRLYHRLGMHLVDDTISVEARARTRPADA